MDADGSNVAVLLDGFGVELAWSPCDDKIAYIDDVTAPGTYSIVLVNADGSPATVVTEGEQPSWSPECSKIAFIREFVSELNFLGIDVWITEADGSRERKRTRRE